MARITLNKVKKEEHFLCSHDTKPASGHNSNSNQNLHLCLCFWDDADELHGKTEQGSIYITRKNFLYVLSNHPFLCFRPNVSGKGVLSYVKFGAIREQVDLYLANKGKDDGSRLGGSHLKSQHSGGWSMRIIMNSKPAWATQWDQGKPGLQSKALPQKTEIKQNKMPHWVLPSIYIISIINSQRTMTKAEWFYYFVTG